MRVRARHANMAASPQQGHTCGLLPAHTTGEGAACCSCDRMDTGRRLSRGFIPLLSAQLRHGYSSCRFLSGWPGCASIQGSTCSKQALRVKLGLHKAGRSVARSALQHSSQSLATIRWLCCCRGRASQHSETLSACRGEICTQSMQHLVQAADGLAWILPVTPPGGVQLPGTARTWVSARIARGMLRQARRSWQPDHGRRC